MGEAMTPGAWFGQRVRRVRKEKLWDSQERLVEELSRLGHGTGRSTITRLEGGARRPDLDEALAISLALGVSPIDLIFPGDVEAANVTPTEEVPTVEARAWFRGFEPIPGQDRRFFENHSHDVWVDATTLRRQGLLRRLVQELAEAEEEGDDERRLSVLDQIQAETKRQKREGR